MVDDRSPTSAPDDSKGPRPTDPVGLTLGHAIAARSIIAAFETILADEPAAADRIALSLHGFGAEGTDTYLPAAGRWPASEKVVDGETARAYVRLVRQRLNEVPSFFDMFKQPD